MRIWIDFDVPGTIFNIFFGNLLEHELFGKNSNSILKFWWFGMSWGAFVGNLAPKKHQARGAHFEALQARSWVLLSIFLKRGKSLRKRESGKI